MSSFKVWQVASLHVLLTKKNIVDIVSMKIASSSSVTGSRRCTDKAGITGSRNKGIGLTSRI